MSNESTAEGLVRIPETQLEYRAASDVDHAGVEKPSTEPRSSTEAERPQTLTPIEGNSESTAVTNQPVDASSPQPADALSALQDLVRKARFTIESAAAADPSADSEIRNYFFAEGEFGKGRIAQARRSTKVIELHARTARVASLKVPKIGYDFYADFPQAARQRIVAQRRRAEDVLAEKKKTVDTFESAEALLLEFVVEVFAAFAGEAIQLGVQGVLTAAEIEQECDQFLDTCIIASGLIDGHLVVFAWGKSEVTLSVERRIASSDHWKNYLRRLGELRDSQTEESMLDGALIAEGDPGRAGRLIIDGWLQAYRPDWREDAAYARENPRFLRPAKVARLFAIASLHEDAAAAVRDTMPATKEQLGACLRPVFSKYARAVFDKLAEAELIALGPGPSLIGYSRWLRKKCLPAVVDDLCGGFFCQITITCRHVIASFGKSYSAQIESTRGALWGLTILGETVARSLADAISTELEARSTYWDARAASPPAPEERPWPRNQVLQELRPPAGNVVGDGEQTAVLPKIDTEPDASHVDTATAAQLGASTSDPVEPAAVGTEPPTPSATPKRRGLPPDEDDNLRTDTPKPRLSERDSAIHDLVGEQNFQTLTNAEISRIPSVKKGLRQHSLMTEDAAKSCFYRIRNAKAYTLSREIQKKRSTKR